MPKKGFDPSYTRTVALVGHRSSGKTSLGDLLLQATGATRTVGRVDDGTSLLDHTAEARSHHQTVEPSSAWVTWRDHVLYVIDTPGAQDLALDGERCMRASDAFVLVVAANDGVEHMTRRLLATADAERLPGLVVVQQIDRAHDLGRILEDLQSATGRRVVPLHLPFVDDEGEFAGIVDLPTQRAHRYATDESGTFSPEPLPHRLGGPAAGAWERVVEAVAMEDEEVLERYLEYLELPTDEVLSGLASAVRASRILPVLLTSAARVVGAASLLDAIVDLLPAPTARLRGLPDDDSFSATVVHTTIDAEGRPWSLLRVWTGNGARGGDWVSAATGARSRVRKLFSVRGPRRAAAHTAGPGALVATWDAVEARPGDVLAEDRLSLPIPDLPPCMITRVLVPRTRTDAERLERALPVLLRMDHALEIRPEAGFLRVALSGRSSGQLNRAREWLRKRMGVGVDLELPAVGYREAPIRGAGGVEGVHVREIQGLVEEYGRCAITLDPDAACADIAYAARCSDEDVPARFQGAIGAGAREAALRGPLAGYPVIGARVTCVGGDYDMLCSTADHFRLAGAAAMRAALEETGTRLLEPWSQITVHAPADGVGAVLKDLTANRGRIVDVRVGAEAEVHALCPERETRTLASRLSALTGGRAWFETRHSHYDVLPEALLGEALRGAPRAPPPQVRTDARARP